MALKSREGIPAQKIINIKHGNAPEIQAVNISVVKRRSAISDASRPSDDILYQTTDSEIERAFHRRRPVSKTMTTTKSTMTNEEDYQIEVTKTQDEEESSNSGSLASDGREQLAAEANNDNIQLSNVKDAQQQKVLAWKMTPKVHFPIRRDSALITPIQQETLSQYEKSVSLSNQLVDLNHVPDLVIDPPFEHRPDKSYVIQQNHPIPLNPLKVWPGYGGNLYFEPVRVESKPLYARDGNETNAGSRARSRANSRFTFDRTVTTLDGLSDSKYMSLPPSSPFRSENRKDTEYLIDQDPAMPYKNPMQDLQPGDLLFQRQMAHLDKNYVLDMKSNAKLHEDWSWIAGMESIGTLCIGNLQDSAKKQASKPYSRTLVAEKVPRKFIFHPGNNPQLEGSNSRPRPIPLVQVKIDTKIRKKFPPDYYARWRNKGASNWSGRAKRTNEVENAYSRPSQPTQRSRLPSIPIRVKGRNVNDTSCYNPWELFKIGHSKPLNSDADKAKSDSKTKSRKKQVLSRSKSHFSQLDDKENLSFAITNLLSANGASMTKVGQSHPAAKRSNTVKSADHDTDDEDKLNYETIRSVFYSTRTSRITGDGRKVPNSTPC